MAFDGSAPISEFSAGSAPGSKLKLTGALLLLACIPFAYFTVAEANAEKWTPVSARITSTGVAPPRKDRITWDAWATATYEAKGSSYLYAAKSIPFSDPYAAEAKSKQLMNTNIAIRFDPALPSRTMSEDDLAMNRNLLPKVPFLILFSAILGTFLINRGVRKSRAAREAASTLHVQDDAKVDGDALLARSDTTVDSTTPPVHENVKGDGTLHVYDDVMDEGATLHLHDDVKRNV